VLLLANVDNSAQLESITAAKAVLNFKKNARLILYFLCWLFMPIQAL